MPKANYGVTSAVVDAAAASISQRSAGNALKAAADQGVLPLDPVRAELDKDVWDCRNIPGARVLPSHSSRLLRFDQVPTAFKPLVKRYLKLFITNQSYSGCHQRLLAAQNFLLFYVECYPDAKDLKNLTRAVMEDYLFRVNTATLKNGNPANPRYVYNTLMYLEQFLRYLEAADSPQAPIVSVLRLLWKTDRGRWVLDKQRLDGEPKYVPDGVMVQLEQHMTDLPPAIFPVVVVQRESGFRISDVLNLRHDTCLEKFVGRDGRQTWMICGDIEKTGVKNHKVPISDAVAQVVATQIATVLEKFPVNPHRYLFPSRHSPRREKYPLCQKNVGVALNKLAQKHNITDVNGKVYHFNTHAFRHSKGMALVNSGMPLIYVQKWLAHATPTMTQTYAKLLDTTLIEEYDKIIAKGVMRVAMDSKPYMVDGTMLQSEEQLELEYVRHHLDAIRLPNGFCFLPAKAPCEWRDTPCMTCPSFATVPDMLPQFHKERDDLLIQIEIGRQAGNKHWIEKNTLRLAPVEKVIETLEKGNVHGGHTKAAREYTKAEQEERSKNGQ